MSRLFKRYRVEVGWLLLLFVLTLLTPNNVFADIRCFRYDPDGNVCVEEPGWCDCWVEMIEAAAQ